MKGTIPNVFVFIISIMTLSISATALKKSKLLQANETNNLTPSSSTPLTSDSRSTIDVMGQAKRTVDSDFVKIFLQVATLDSTANESMLKNNKISKELETLITSFDIDIKNITTTDYNISPRYKWVNDTQIFLGYQTRNSLQLTLSNLKLAGKIIDAISKVENVTVSSVSTGVSSQKIDEIKDSLIDEAVADAQRIARLTLRTINSEVKSVATISINNYSSAISPMPSPNVIYAKQVQSAPTLYGNKQEISMSVSIRFKIGPSNQ